MSVSRPADWRGKLSGSRRIPSSSPDSRATSALLSATMPAPTSSTSTSTSPPAKVGFSTEAVRGPKRSRAEGIDGRYY
ncbi:unnamed protein product [Linum tenue]|uniref:Uncharacterized protein n=1 Tax=Linum tenue TaxID=586396 RepID=A0AAV0QPH5_9ROSI|nr:unnamed protein product [Linum tenue]